MFMAIIMPRYRYHTLQHTDSIRVLILHPSSNDSSPITCSIRHARLSDPSLEYEAISYTWGDVTSQQPIYFNNGRRRLRVGTNCHSVLRHLRQKDCDQLLWIDAVCIDQENLVERANQVRIMDMIYRDASNVIVHLGEETLGSRVLFEELAEADTALSSTGDCDRPVPNNILVRELENLLQRPWFRRVWVLQEVAMHTSVTFMCGSAGASCTALLKCLFGYTMGSLVTEQFCPFALDLRRLTLPNCSTVQLSLWDLLYESRDCLATDPRDKVFALRSLISQRHSDMDSLINYVRSVEETFIETALFLLPTLGLRLLTAIRHPHNLEMPSWIPDWSQHLPLDERLFRPVCIKETDTPITDTFFIHSSSRTESSSLELHVKGVRYAQITHISRTFSFNSLEDTKAQMKELYYHLDNLRELLIPADRRDGAISFDQLGQDIMNAMLLLDGPTLHLFLHRYDGWVLDAKPGANSAEEVFGAIQDYFDSLQQCRIILMNNGHIGIVPGAARTEDIVCILQGAKSLCVLRQNLDGHWMLVSGDCFSFNSAYWDDYGLFACDKYVEDNRDRLEQFKIR